MHILIPSPHSYLQMQGVFVGVRGFHSRVILSLCVMGLGSGHLEIFVFRLLNTRQECSWNTQNGQYFLNMCYFWGQKSPCGNVLSHSTRVKSQDFFKMLDFSGSKSPCGNVLSHSILICFRFLSTFFQIPRIYIFSDSYLQFFRFLSTFFWFLESTFFRFLSTFLSDS